MLLNLISVPLLVMLCLMGGGSWCQDNGWLLKIMVYLTWLSVGIAWVVTSRGLRVTRCDLSRGHLEVIIHGKLAQFTKGRATLKFNIITVHIAMCGRKSCV